mgnify:CR=1 FL=1
MKPAAGASRLSITLAGPADYARLADLHDLCFDPAWGRESIIGIFAKPGALGLIARAEGRAAIVKPQIAFFEQMGWRGIEVLTKVVERARALGFSTLLDAKRGDIGSTADGYAKAYLEPGSPIEVDAITLNPYRGLDSLDPFAARAEAHGRGLFVLVKTSNPGSGDLQDLGVAESDPQTKVFAAVASGLAPLSKKLVGKQTGWSFLRVSTRATRLPTGLLPAIPSACSASNCKRGGAIASTAFSRAIAATSTKCACARPMATAPSSFACATIVSTAPPRGLRRTMPSILQSSMPRQSP